MAYQNVQLMGGTIVTGIAPTSALESPPGNVYYSELPSGYTYNASITLKQDSQIINNLPVWIYGDENWGIRVEGSFSGWINLCLYFNGTRIAQMSVYVSASSDKLCRMCVFAGIDESTQKGSVFGMIEFMTSYGTANRYYGGSSEATNNTQLAYNFIKAGELSSITSNGGGATHIAKRTGQLKDLSSYTSDILIVSGGGGGGLLVGETSYTGKEAGGISGSGDNSADQSTGNAFGLGESGTNLSGGGSGLYGGYKGTSSKSGGAGSGYIGNSLLSNKKMVGYNVPTSSSADTKTESVEVFDSNYVANKPKAGNGHARIKLVSEQQTKSFFNVVSSYDLTNVGSGITADSIDYSNYLGQIVFYGQSNRKLLSINDGVFNYTSALSYTQSNLAFPLKDYPIRITKVTCKVTLKELRGDNRWVDLKIICNSGLIGRAKYAFTDPDPVNINVGEETSFTFDVSSSNMQATHIDFQFSYGIWEVKDIMVSYV